MFDAPQVNPKKLFVGNLPYSSSEQELHNLFSQYGEIVSVTLVTDRMSGRSKGFAFVEFADEAAATAAVEGVNGTELDGRALIVNVARPPQPRENRAGSGGGGFRPRSGGGFGGGNRGGSSGGYGGGNNFRGRRDY